MPRALKHFNIRIQVSLSNQPDRKNTIIEIRTLDRPSILATVGRIFHFNILVNSARITTLGECAEDIFFVTDQDQNPIDNQKVCESLQSAIYAALDLKSGKDNRDASGRDLSEPTSIDI